MGWLLLLVSVWITLAGGMNAYRQGRQIQQQLSFAQSTPGGMRFIQPQSGPLTFNLNTPTNITSWPVQPIVSWADWGQFGLWCLVATVGLAALLLLLWHARRQLSPARERIILCLSWSGFGLYFSYHIWHFVRVWVL